MTAHIITGNCRERLREMKSQSVNCCVTSPPYFNLRDYEVEGQIGMEETPDKYVAELVEVFEEMRRVLRSDGTFWLNLGDSYAGAAGQATRGGPPSASSTLEGNGHRGGGPKLAKLSRVGRSGNRGNGAAAPGLKPKDLIGIPWRVAFALQAAGWWLRSEIIWAKPNGLPGSQEDRCTSSHETIFMFSKSASYWSDFDAIKTPPRESTRVRIAQDVQTQAGSQRGNGGGKINGPMKAVGCAKPVMMRDVWFVPPASFSDAHFAIMPDEIARRCIAAGCPEGGSVLDPFGGAGTTGLVAERLGRDSILIELNPVYAEMSAERIRAANLGGGVIGIERLAPERGLPLFSEAAE